MQRDSSVADGGVAPTLTQWKATRGFPLSAVNPIYTAQNNPPATRFSILSPADQQIVRDFMYGEIPVTPENVTKPQQPVTVTQKQALLAAIGQLTSVRAPTQFTEWIPISTNT